MGWRDSIRSTLAGTDLCTGRGESGPGTSETAGYRRAAGELSAPLWLDSFPALAGLGQMP